MAHLAANAEARTEGLGGNSRIPVEYRQSISYPVCGLPGAGIGQKQGWRRIGDDSGATLDYGGLMIADYSGTLESPEMGGFKVHVSTNSMCCTLWVVSSE
jgi:hypothetical protein